MAKSDAKKAADEAAIEPKFDERDARIAELEAALADAKKAADEAATSERQARAALGDAHAEIALMLEDGASKVAAVARRVVHVRSRAENPAGLFMYGKQVTRAGFELDVTDFNEREMESLLGDPNLEVDA